MWIYVALFCHRHPSGYPPEAMGRTDCEARCKADACALSVRAFAVCTLMRLRLFSFVLNSIGDVWVGWSWALYCKKISDFAICRACRPARPHCRCATPTAERRWETVTSTGTARSLEQSPAGPPGYWDGTVKHEDQLSGPCACSNETCPFLAISINLPRLFSTCDHIVRELFFLG